MVKGVGCHREDFARANEVMISGPMRSAKIVPERAEKIGEKLMGKPESTSRILVLDVPSRRELGDVPRWPGAVSENGEWLATIDEEGIARVWRMPLAKPWARSVGYALAIVLGALFMDRLIRWMRVRVSALRRARIYGEADVLVHASRCSE